uniref:Ig-like domain-containing protein n=1 Tax=Gopherus agassizii TaxID=38772 RepID=A0A452IBR4_9SAUR
LVPCTFTYPASYYTDNFWDYRPDTRLYGYWYKDPANESQDPPVASSDPSRGVSQETQGRFRLAGELVYGDCSLLIREAQWRDTGRYFFRFEKGTLKYSYLFNSDGTDAKVAISVPGTLLAREPVTVICTAPGHCSGPPPLPSSSSPKSALCWDPHLPPCTLSTGIVHPPQRGHVSVPGKRSLYQQPPCPTLVVAASQLLSGGSLGGPNPPAHLPVPDVWGAEADVVSLETQEGDSLSLSCEVGSRSKGTLSWAKGNESLSPGQEGAGHLELPNLSRGDAGEYWCWVKNSYGLASRTLRVHVQSKELGGARPQGGSSVEGAGLQGKVEGDSLRFLCSVASSPPAVLGWVRGGRIIEGASLEGENQLRLELPNVTAEDGGLYGCWAQNKQSSAQGTFRLLIECECGNAFAGRVGEMRLGQPMQSAQQGLPGVSALLLTQGHKTPAACRTKGVQDEAAAAQAPLGPGEPDELHYATINFSKLQRKLGEPPEAPDMEYSEVRLK